jgi:hypothetical protein
MMMKWPFKTRYVVLLEAERERLLVENSNLQMRVEQMHRALLVSSNSTAAHTYINREEPREKPKRTERAVGDISGTWDEYQALWAIHLDHEGNRVPNACQFCKAESDAEQERKKDRKGISVVETGKAS